MNAEPRIALIDDDRNWAETFADFLRTKGFGVQTAYAAAEGLALLEKINVSLVLVDLNMPDMDGLSLVRRLRQRQNEVTVLLVSGDDEPSLVARALAAGVRAFVPKSSPPGMLLKAVQEALGLVINGRSKSRDHSKRHLPVLRKLYRTLPVPSAARRTEG